MSQKWMHILTRYQVSATARIRLLESMAQIKLARAREQTLSLYPLSDCLCQKPSRWRNLCSTVPRKSQLLLMDSLYFPSRRFHREEKQLSTDHRQRGNVSSSGQCPQCPRHNYVSLSLHFFIQLWSWLLIIMKSYDVILLLIIIPKWCWSIM